MRTVTYFNNRNDAPLSNKKIQEAIYKVIAKEESDTHTVTADTFNQLSNTKKENAKAILTSEKQDKFDALAETIKGCKSTTLDIMDQNE